MVPTLRMKQGVAVEANIDGDFRAEVVKNAYLRALQRCSICESFKAPHQAKIQVARLAPVRHHLLSAIMSPSPCFHAGFPALS